MRAVVDDPVLGQITYDENLITDKRTLFIGGAPAVKQKKRTYTFQRAGTAETAQLRGNFLTGVTLQVGERSIVLMRPMYWYEVLLGCLPAIFIIWANASPIYLIPGIPVIGGGMGGFLSGLMVVISLVFMRRMKNIFWKVLFGLAMVFINLLLGTVCSVVILYLFYIG